MPTVLIVEDNRALAYAVADVLRSIGYGTLIAHDGEATLSEAERSLPEVVIVDLELPAIDGLGVARRLREATASRSGLSPTPRWLRRCAHQADLDLSDYQGRSAQRQTALVVIALVDWAGKVCGVSYSYDGTSPTALGADAQRK